MTVKRVKHRNGCRSPDSTACVGTTGCFAWLSLGLSLWLFLLLRPVFRVAHLRSGQSGAGHHPGEWGPELSERALLEEAAEQAALHRPGQNMHHPFQRGKKAQKAWPSLPARAGTPRYQGPRGKRWSRGVGDGSGALGPVWPLRTLQLPCSRTGLEKNRAVTGMLSSQLSIACAVQTASCGFRPAPCGPQPLDVPGQWFLLQPH